MAKKTGLLEAVAAEVAKNPKTGIGALSAEQLAEVNEMLDTYPTIGRGVLAEIASKWFGVNVSRTSLADYDRKRRAR